MKFNELLNINFVLEGCLVEYLETHPHFPDYMYLGEKECNKLDKYYGAIVSHFMNIEIVMTMKRSFVSFGDKLENI